MFTPETLPARTANRSIATLGMGCTWLLTVNTIIFILGSDAALGSNDQPGREILALIARTTVVKWARGR